MLRILEEFDHCKCQEIMLFLICSSKAPMVEKEVSWFSICWYWFRESWKSLQLCTLCLVLLCGPVCKKNLVTWENLQGKIFVNRLVSCHHWLSPPPTDFFTPHSLRLTWRKTQPLFSTFVSSVRAAALSNATFLASSFSIRQKLNDSWLSLTPLLWKQL